MSIYEMTVLYKDNTAYVRASILIEFTLPYDDQVKLETVWETVSEIEFVFSG